MSYILEALKKAEAERNGTKPNAFPLPPGFATANAKVPAWRNPWVWAALATLAGIAGGATWLTMQPVQSVQPVQPQQDAAARPLLHPLAQAPTPQLAADAGVDTPKESPSAPWPKPVKEMPEKKPQSLADAPKPTPAPTPQPAVEPPLPALRELPEQIQRAIPTVNVGGYIYSANRADRSALINNRLLREGDEIASGLTLESMTQSGMVLNYKGYRYRLSY